MNGALHPPHVENSIAAIVFRFQPIQTGGTNVPGVA